MSGTSIESRFEGGPSSPVAVRSESASQGRAREGGEAPSRAAGMPGGSAATSPLTEARRSETAPATLTESGWQKGGPVAGAREEAERSGARGATPNARRAVLAKLRVSAAV